MSKTRESPRPCAVCGRSFAPRDLVSGGLVHDRVSEGIRAEHPQWSQESFICRPDLSHFRAQHVRSMLESEKGELSSLDQSVLASLREHEVLAKNIEAEFERNPSLGQATRKPGLLGTASSLRVTGPLADPKIRSFRTGMVRVLA